MSENNQENLPRAFRKKRKPRGKPFEKGNKVGNRFKPGESGNPDGRPKTTRSPSEVLQEIEKLAFANMLDYMSITQDGQAFVDFSKLTREQAAAIQEIRVDESAGGVGDGRRERVQRTTFKLADKGINLERLCRHHKLLTDKVEFNTSDELIQRLTAGRKRASNHNT